MKISYAITVCNENKEIDKLLTFLFKHKRKEDQVVVQMDTSATKEVWAVCESFEGKPFEEYRLIENKLNKNFAAHKNNLNKNCDGDWIFAIDADEIPDEYLMEALPFILDVNSEVEAYWVPRVNTDWQMRIYRNTENIYWIKPVHEQLKGYTKFANLPAEEKFALHHPKNIGRQEKQNAFYDTI